MGTPRVHAAPPLPVTSPLSMLAVGAAAAASGLAVAVIGSPSALLAILGFAVGLMALTHPRVALVAFAFAMYLNAPVVAMTHYGVPPFVAASTAGLLAVPAAIQILRGAPVLLPHMFTAMLAYLAVMLASSAVSTDPRAALSSTLIYASEGLVFTVLLVNAVRTRGDLRAVLWTILVAGALMGALSLHQELTGAHGNDYGGFAQVRDLGFAVPDGSAGETVRPRAEGPIGERNRYAQVLAVLLPIAFFMLRGTKNRLGQAVVATIGLLVLSGLLLTFSRMGLLAIGGALALLLLLRYLKLRDLMLSLILISGFTIAVTPDWAVRVQSIADAGGLIREDPDAADGAIRARLVANIGAWRTFVDHPLIGVGPDQYGQKYSGPYSLYTGLRAFSASSSQPAHNLYLHIAADTGILGLASFLTIVSGILMLLWRRRAELIAQRDEGSLMVTALFTVILLYLGTGMFLHMSYERYFWILIALASAALFTHRPTARITPGSSNPMRPDPAVRPG